MSKKLYKYYHYLSESCLAKVGNILVDNILIASSLVQPFCTSKDINRIAVGGVDSE